MAKATTAYGKRKVAEGVSDRRLGGAQTVLGGAALGIGAISVATGDFIFGGAMIGAGSSTLNSGLKRMGKGNSTVSKGRATESLINRAKTGNTLGIPGARKMAAGTPPQIGPTSIDAAFKSANKQFTGDRDAKAQSGNGGVSAGKKGWANPKTQAAAQKAKGNNYNGPSE